MNNKYSIKQQLISGTRLHGCWIESFSTINAEIMGQSGYEVAVIDLEHGPGSILDAVHMMQVLAAFDCAPIVRVMSSNPNTIKKAMDIGPAGIMVPNIENPQEAKDVVAACRYGPTGIRGSAPMLVRASGYGQRLESYLKNIERDFLLIGQIESKQALDRIEEIAAIDGIDMLFVGPSDLSASLGALGNYESETFINAFERIEKVTLAAGKLLGSIPFHNWDAKRLYKNGHQLVVSGADTLLLRKAAENDVQTMTVAKGN